MLAIDLFLASFSWAPCGFGLESRISMTLSAGQWTLTWTNIFVWSPLLDTEA